MIINDEDVCTSSTSASLNRLNHWDHRSDFNRHAKMENYDDDYDDEQTSLDVTPKPQQYQFSSPGSHSKVKSFSLLII